MPYGDYKPPEGWVWNDAVGWCPSQLQEASLLLPAKVYLAVTKTAELLINQELDTLEGNGG